MASTGLSWFQAEPTSSLDLIASAGTRAGAAVLDIGGGTSFLAGRLLALGYRVGVMDISEVALDQSRARLGTEAAVVEWIHADVLNFVSRHPWDVWHDRAVFHFLTDQRDRLAYKATLLRTIALDGVAVIATFGPNAPERCSGLPTARYSPDALAQELGDDLVLIADHLELHRTPRGATQEFVWCAFRRAAA
jgi:SAM-dependent methyltransferase